jgi:hypothetical protein
MAACPKFLVGCRLGRELFTLPYADADVMEPWAVAKKLYTSVVMTPAPVRVPTQRLLVLNFR